MVLKNPYKLITQNSLVNVSSACAKNLYCYWMYYSIIINEVKVVDHVIWSFYVFTKNICFGLVLNLCGIVYPFNSVIFISCNFKLLIMHMHARLYICHSPLLPTLVLTEHFLEFYFNLSIGFKLLIFKKFKGIIDIQ